MNKALLHGFLAADPELKYTPEGSAVCTFRMATNEVYKNKAGEKAQKTEWHRIVVWRKLAEICSEYLKKGSEVIVEGKIRTREWADKEGNKRFTTEIEVSGVGSAVHFVGGNGKEKTPKGSAPDEAYTPPFPSGSDESDEIPF